MPKNGVDNNNGKTNSKVVNVLLVTKVASVAFASAMFMDCNVIITIAKKEKKRDAKITNCILDYYGVNKTTTSKITS